MRKVGVISGTLTLQRAVFPEELIEKTIRTRFGTAMVLDSPSLALIPRHGKDHHRHILPHRINHAANLAALKALGVDEVVAINSTGSLKKTLKPGNIVIPNDFIMLHGGPTTSGTKPMHITPSIHERIRQQLIEAAHCSGVAVVDGGVYWQTPGPRLETRAEIRLISRFADVIGMTMASEAVVAQELDIPYASLCSVDNFAHGIGDSTPTIKSVLQHARMNTERIVRIIEEYLKGEKP